MKTKNLLYILPLAALVACEPEIDEIDFNGGSADFSNYVALGNSLTAGFQSNALSANGQLNSYPAMLAEQFQTAGASTKFNIPLLTGEFGSRGANIDSIGTANALILPELVLGISTDCNNENPGPSPKLNGGPTGVRSTFLTSVTNQPPYNNYGVPGAKSYHLGASNYGNSAGLMVNPPQSNGYYSTFVNAQDPSESVITAAVKANPTFFSLWIGNNDVLSYATSGGSGINQLGNTNPATYGSRDLTDPTAFAGVYNSLITALTANDAKGVVANIPDVTSIPFFTTIPTRGLPLTAEQAAFFNGFADTTYNAGLTFAVSVNAITQAEADRRKLSFTAGANYFITVDNTLSNLQDPRTGNPVPKLRQLAPGDYLTLATPQAGLRCAGLGSVVPNTTNINPIPDALVLDAEEVNSVRTATNAFNASIKSIADANNLAFFDANARLRELATVGITVSGINFSSAFIAGGAFSLDGVHPSTRGYAILANDFIDAINSKYGANVPKVDVASYPAIEIQ